MYKKTRTNGKLAVPTANAPDLKSLDQVKHIHNHSTHDHVTSSSHLQPTFVTRTCKETEFQCITDGACIENYKFCNGYNDCTDHSDEAYDVCSQLQNNYIDGKLCYGSN